MVRKKLDERVRTLIERGVQKSQRSILVLVGDHGKGQLHNLQQILTKNLMKARPKVLLCYKRELGFSTHRNLITVLQLNITRIGIIQLASEKKINPSRLINPHIDNSGQSKEITITPITAHQLNVYNGKKTIKAPKERMCYVNKSKVMEQDKENNKNKTQHCT